MKIYGKLIFSSFSLPYLKKYVIIYICTCGGMVDAADSKSAEVFFVGVQVPSRAPKYKINFNYRKTNYFYNS